MLYNPLLNSFIVVVNTGSFSKASQQLYISNTAIMKQMNQLEMQCGFSLFQRSHSGIKLTNGGKYVYQEALKLINQSNEILENAKKIEDTKSYTIRIGSSYLDPSYILTNLWDSISAQFPNYQLEIIPFIDNKKNPNSVLNNIGIDYDIVIGCHGSSPKTNQFLLKEIGFTVAMPKNHPLATREVIELEDIKKQTIMIGNSTSSSPINEVRTYLLDHNVQLESVDSFYDLSTFNRCAASQNLLLCLPHWTNIHPNLINKKVKWEFQNQLYIYYSKKKEVCNFVQLLQQYLTKNPNLQLF
ncbi:MAG: LysR family transcriptional regulator [Firmicutes bacterium]|nr:LysR family transcriptional regulator [Bacillota bacterium]